MKSVRDLDPIRVAASLAALKEAFPGFNVILSLSDGKEGISASDLPMQEAADAMRGLIEQLEQQVALTEAATANTKH